MRRAPSQVPLSAPYFSIASAVYREQLGVYRHELGSSGAKPTW